MKQFILALCLIVSFFAQKAIADNQEMANNAPTTEPTEAPICHSDSTICIPEEQVSLNLLKYMLSQGANINDIENGLLVIDGKRVIIEKRNNKTTDKCY